MQDKKSFVMYTDYLQHFELLSDEQLGQLMRSIFSYAADSSTEPELRDPALMMAFSFIRAALDRDMESYEAMCRRNAGNGRKGGRPKKKHPEHPESTDSTESAAVAEKAEPVVKSESAEHCAPEKAAYSAAEKSFVREKDSTGVKNAADIPTLEEVRKYCAEKNYTFSPEKFVSHYQAYGWSRANRPVRSWRALADMWQQNERPAAKSSRAQGNYILPVGCGAAYDISDYEGHSVCDEDYEL